MMNFRTNDIIILTGAGFTKNFGGFLASEMWCKIFNNPLVQKNEKLVEKLQKQLDFEKVYSEVDTDDYFDENDKDLLRKSIENAYYELQFSLDQWHENESCSLAFRGTKLFNIITQNHKEKLKDLFFTLNQDLFMERQGYITPGTNKFIQTGLENIANLNTVQLPNEEGIKKIHDDILSMSSMIYIKLHGSYGWKSYDTQKIAMVIGKNKLEDIKKEPLLNEYWQIFNDVIAQGNKKILIIGYSFGDEHVNNVLINGVERYNLQIYIINNELPDNFIKNNDVNLIWKGVKGYFPYLLKEICPLNDQKTSYFKEIEKALLERS